MKNKSNKILLIFTFLLLALSFLNTDTFGQNQLLRTCGGNSPNPREAKVEVTKLGAINFITCAGQTVLLNGNVLEGTGTVTSVGLSLPSIFSLSGSPITGAGTLTATLANQSGNKIFASPANGSSGSPLFRTLVAADIPALDAANISTGVFAASQIPSLNASKLTAGVIDTARLGTGTASSNTFLRGDGTWQIITVGSVSSVGLALPSIFSVTGSPVTGAGTLTATLANQSGNVVFASPANGSSGSPLFRTLVAADIPALDAAKITTGTFATSQIPALDAAKITTGTFATSQIPNLNAGIITGGVMNTARLGTGTASSNTFLRGDGTWAAVPSSSNYLRTYTANSTNYSSSDADSNKVFSLCGGTFTMPTLSLSVGYHISLVNAGCGAQTVSFGTAVTLYTEGGGQAIADSEITIGTGAVSLIYLGSTSWAVLSKTATITN